MGQFTGTFIGNLGRDPELKVTPNGKEQVRFSMAINGGYYNSADEYQQTTEWIEVLVLGDNVRKYAMENLRRGDKVILPNVGAEVARWFHSESGVPQMRVKAIVRNRYDLEFAGSPAAKTSAPTESETTSMEQEDLPFD